MVKWVIARVNIDILGISELKWTGMGEFNGQMTIISTTVGKNPLEENGVALIVNKRVQNAVQFSSVAQSCPILQPHGLQHTRPPCLSPTPGVYSNSCPLSRWCHPTISSSVIPFSSPLQSFPASGSFPTSQFFTYGGQSIGVSASASVLPMNIQDWFPLGWTGWICLLSKGPWRDFSNTTVQNHQFLGAQLSL